SSGRLVDALTDIIRPFSERQGLKGDLIRLQREEVALKVAEIAAKRIEHEKLEITPAPLKTVVRILEASSLESIGDEVMINLWANLLASAATDTKSNVPRYVSILADLNGDQARLLQKIITYQGAIKEKLDVERIWDGLWGADQGSLISDLTRHVKEKTAENIFNKLEECLRLPGIALEDIIIEQGEESWSGTTGMFPISQHQRDLDILLSLNLVQDRSFKYVKFGKFEISVFFFCVSRLGLELFAACNPDIIKPST
ncbi:Abi-alpha family protein, partial [Roseococcus thiosulfatophilus]|uniref:Abi-alpha family protein n=1 Tax=Roseococcus thiosulfatophilus TaxID=35813 RepID=UPI001A8C81E7